MTRTPGIVAHPQPRPLMLNKMATGTSHSQSVTVDVDVLAQAIVVAIQRVSTTRPYSREQSPNEEDTDTLGRPLIPVNLEEVKELRSLNYKWKQIAIFLGVSRSTLYRRLREHGINNFTSLTEEQLDAIVHDVKKTHPHDGEVLVQGHLRSINVQVPRQALRNSIHRVDSSGVAMCSTSTIRRRIYSVPYPNFVWHLDGHHKLIRWRFVVHGAIDGFSRMITFLHCSDNNRAETVFSHFVTAIEQYGLPHHVRTDLGGENVDIWRCMVASHNDDVSSVITGSSVHNERVERLWRDVNRCVCRQFSITFRSLEIENTLDPLNNVDMYCLHQIFMPKINRCLSEFKESWNHHSLSSEGNKTPYQLFFEGMAYMTTVHHFNPGVSTDISSIQAEVERISVPRILFQPCILLLMQIALCLAVHSDDHCGKTVYGDIIEQAGQHLLHGCSNDCQYYD